MDTSRAFRTSAVLLFACAACIAAAEPSPAPKAPIAPERVVILVIDGPRWSETWGDPQRANIPKRAGELAAAGMMWTDFSNSGPTYTNAGHTAMTTGFDQPIDNRGRELPAHPGIFQLHLEKSGAPATDAWIVSSKDKLAILADTVDPAWKGKFLCSLDCGVKGNGTGYRDDATTMKRVREVLTNHHPHLMLINLKEPDASGHAKDWQAYLQGIRDTDAYAGRLWTWLQEDPIYAGKTALFITNDHGRHLDANGGFAEHGCDCLGCRHIELLALGPFSGRGSSSERRDLRDLAATVASILGVTLAGSPGRVLDELVKPAAAPPP
ncbi:MAG: alkaline phosphatase family protein [Planctomycetes bacterium]|nr:alkaline phosphatase family protein [Planctomycetota bacterium]